MDAEENVTLRTNKTVPRVTLETILMLLKDKLYNARPVAFYDLVMACRDASHAPFGAQILKDLGLVESIDPTTGLVEIRTDIRHIVLASSEGEGARIHLVSPYKA